MAPVKKQKANESFKIKNNHEKKTHSKEKSVVSGQLQKKIDKKQLKLHKDPKGVVFIKHLPHGFFEEQLRKYFEQFGNVTRVRLARSRRTGNSKGYAFVEFEYPEVAEVAAETMDNYLMFKQIVKAYYIPPEKQQFNYFRTSVKRIRNKSGKMIWVSRKTASLHHKIKKRNDWSDDNYQKRTKKQLNKLKKMGEKYAHLGIDINEIIFPPKILTEKEKLQKKSVEGEPMEINTAGNSKAIKTKTLNQEVISNKQQKLKKSKMSLEDILGDTIQEDSEDEDYIATAESENDTQESAESSDEETYNFSKELDTECNTDDESASEKSLVIKKKTMKFGKTLKNSNVERFDQMVKRKPYTGGINKLNKKPLKQPSVTTKNKKALQITAAKDLAKPLSKIKEKLSRPLKSKKNLIQVK